MKIYIVPAWTRGSPNVVPIAQAEFRSITLADQTAKLWSRDFSIQRFEREANGLTGQSHAK